MKSRRKASPIIAAATQSGKAVRWSVHILRKRAQWLGHVDAVSEREAVEKAREAFDIAPADRFRIVATRE